MHKMRSKMSHRYVFFAILLHVHAHSNHCCSMENSRHVQKEWLDIMRSLDTQTKHQVMTHVVHILGSKSPRAAKIMQGKFVMDPDAGSQYSHFELLRQVNTLVSLIGNRKALEPQIRHYVLSNHIHQQDINAVLEGITEIIQTFLSVTHTDETVWKPCLKDIEELLHSIVVDTDKRGYVYARCDIDPNSGDPTQAIHGSITLEQVLFGGSTVIEGNISGFDNTDNNIKHGFHIHTNGALGNQCKDAGGHYNPHGTQHAGPMDKKRHVGDLGNIDEDETGTAYIYKWDSQLTLTGPYGVIDRTIVVHAGTDDLGRGMFPDSAATGHAGGRLACCIITQVDSLT